MGRAGGGREETGEEGEEEELKRGMGKGRNKGYLCFKYIQRENNVICMLYFQWFILLHHTGEV